MIFSIAHWSVLTSYVRLWSQEFGQNPGLYGKTMLLVGVFENILDVRQCIHDLGVSFAFTRRSEGGGTVQSLASLSSLSSCCHPAKEVRGTEPRVKEPKISTLVWSPLVNGEACLRYYGYYSLHIKCKIILPDPWCEVWFEYCVLNTPKDNPSPSPPPFIPRAGQGSQWQRDVGKLYPLPTRAHWVLRRREERDALLTTTSRCRAKWFALQELQLIEAQPAAVSGDKAFTGPLRVRGSLALEGGRQSQCDFVFSTYQEKEVCNEMKTNFSKGSSGERNGWKESD